MYWVHNDIEREYRVLYRTHIALYTYHSVQYRAHNDMYSAHNGMCEDYNNLNTAQMPWSVVGGCLFVPDCSAPK